MRLALKKFKHGRLTGRKSGLDTRAVRRGRLTFVKPKQVAAEVPKPAPKAIEAPRPLFYQLLPLATIRRHIRAPFRDRGKTAKYHKPHRRLRVTRYKPLPDGGLWPQGQRVRLLGQRAAERHARAASRAQAAAGAAAGAAERADAAADVPPPPPAQPTSAGGSAVGEATSLQ